MPAASETLSAALDAVLEVAAEMQGDQEGYLTDEEWSVLDGIMDAGAEEEDLPPTPGEARDAALLYLLEAKRDADGELLDREGVQADVRAILASAAEPADSVDNVTRKSSFFQTCDRDDKGHCKPGTGGGASPSAAPDAQSIVEQDHILNRTGFSPGDVRDLRAIAKAQGNVDVMKAAKLARALARDEYGSMNVSHIQKAVTWLQHGFDPATNLKAKRVFKAAGVEMPAVAPAASAGVPPVSTPTSTSDAPRPAAAVDAAAPPASRLASAWEKTPGAKHNLVDLADLKAAAGLSRDDLHSLIRDLQRRGIVSLSPLEGRHGNTPEQLAIALPGHGGQQMGHASIRDGMEDAFRLALQDIASAAPRKGSAFGRAMHRKSLTLKASFFETCERDDAGHCKPGTGESGDSGESGAKDKPAEKKKPAAKKKPESKPEPAAPSGPADAAKPKAEATQTKPAKAKRAPKVVEVASEPQPEPPEPPRSAKALRAQKSAVRVDKTIQRYTEEYNEPRFAKVLEGESLPDSEPVDVVTDAAGVELKTMVRNGNGKLTMDKYAQVRKVVWEQEQGKTFHTVVSDDQQVFNAKGAGQHDDSRRVYYYRRGVAGSARIGSLYKCASEEEVKQLMSLPEEDLPDAAKRTDQKYRAGKWEFVPTGERGAGYYRNSETGEEAHPKK